MLCSISLVKCSVLDFAIVHHVLHLFFPVGSIKSKCLSGTDFIGDVTETSLKNEPLTEFVDLIKSSDSDEKV